MTKAKDPSVHAQLLKMDSKDASRIHDAADRARIVPSKRTARRWSRLSLSYLRLREAEGGRQLRPLWQGQVLRPLEPALQLLDLQRRVDGPRLPHLLAFTVDPCQFAILYRLFNVICNDRWAREQAVCLSVGHTCFALGKERPSRKVRFRQ